MVKTFLLISIGGILLYGISYLISQKTTASVISLREKKVSLLEQKVSPSVSLVASTTEIKAQATSTDLATSSPVRIVTHLKTPQKVEAFYMTSWVAGTKNAKNKLITATASTNINTFVIDIKDNTGVVSWNGRIKKDDLEKLIDELHGKGYYLIARVTAFQDPLFAKEYPSEAIHKSDGTLWKSKKGEAWVDPGSKKMWNYLSSLGEESYALGFDEINLDYIRFSTDGLKENLVFPLSKERAGGKREEVISEFYSYITNEFHKKGIPVSGDVFGIITTSKEDTFVLGQNFATALKYFDYVAPMVYPSHYAAGTFGYKNPAAHPGPVITESLLGAIKIADDTASSTGQSTSTLRAKIRPWYQDFNMGAVYTKELVRAQIDAGDKLGVTSYMMWDPNNNYTISAYK